MTETRCAPAPGRAVLRVTGPDREKYLQGLVTQDMGRILRDGIGYAALLTPQGKLIADFLLVAQPDCVLIDVAADLADDLTRRLTMFKLRSRVEIAPVDLPVTRGIGPAPDGAQHHGHDAIRAAWAPIFDDVAATHCDGEGYTAVCSAIFGSADFAVY